METKKAKTTYSPAILAELKRIKSQKVRKYNKLGEWYYSDKPGKFNIEVVDMRAVLK